MLNVMSYHLDVVADNTLIVLVVHAPNSLQIVNFITKIYYKVYCLHVESGDWFLIFPLTVQNQWVNSNLKLSCMCN